MKILVSCLAYDDGKSGISDYINSTVQELLALGDEKPDQEHQLWLLIHPSDARVFPLRHPRLQFIYLAEWLKRPLFSMLWHLYLLPLKVKLKSYDLVFLPAGNRRLLARYPENVVLTFHDLSQFHIPGKYDRFRTFYVKQLIPHYLAKARRIQAISENTKNDLLRYYRIKPTRITVNYNGYNPDKLDHPVSEEALRQKLGTSKKYLLYISRLEHPGKNHVNLLRAYNLLPEEIQGEYDLICAGSPWNGSEAIYLEQKKLKFPGNVIFPGFVTNEEMAALYRNASLYVFPSLYEGFGIPILEAFYCGVPVICSNRSSLPEIGGTAVLTFNPEDPASIASRIREILESPALQEDMIRKGKERLALFSWRSHVKNLLALVK